MINEMILIYSKCGPFHFLKKIISLEFALFIYGKYSHINFFFFLIISLEFALPVAYGEETSRILRVAEC